MALYPKEIADKLYEEGKMPEWFYRQHYKSFQENWRDSFNKRRQLVKDRQRIALEKDIEAAAEKVIEKAIEDILKSIDK